MSLNAQGKEQGAQTPLPPLQFLKNYEKKSLCISNDEEKQKTQRIFLGFLESVKAATGCENPSFSSGI